jgi:hypothetical protein
MAGIGTAAQGADLYQGEVVVEDQSSGARNAALAEALAQVLVKVTGNPEAPDAGGVRGHLSKASQYVQQYQYRAEERPRPDGESAKRVLLLRARFDPTAVERILREASLARWGEERPTVLVWLVMQRGGERELVGVEEPGIVNSLHRAADRRGLPILLPLLDLADQRVVATRELWGGFTDSLVEASARYGTETFMLGRLSEGGGEWRGRWTLYDQGRERHFESKAETLGDVLADGVASSADALGSRYAVPVTEQAGSRVRLAVEGVTRLPDYDRVLDYLAGLTLVQETSLIGVQDDTLSLELLLSAGLDRLDQTIGLGSVLTRSPASVAVDADSTDLTYHRHYVLAR